MNTQTQEALHKALKVLNCLNNNRVYETAWVKGAINACEEALAQPAQEVGDAEIKQMLDDIEYYQKRIEELEQPAQEPVAWMSEGGIFTRTKEHAEIWSNNGGKVTPVYTHPAQSWQGLSDDEIFELSIREFTKYEFARAIEQALKEKNT